MLMRHFIRRLLKFLKSCFWFYLLRSYRGISERGTLWLLGNSFFYWSIFRDPTRRHLWPCERRLLRDYLRANRVQVSQHEVQEVLAAQRLVGLIGKVEVVAAKGFQFYKSTYP